MTPQPPGLENHQRTQTHTPSLGYLLLNSDELRGGGTLPRFKHKLLPTWGDPAVAAKKGLMRRGRKTSAALR